MVANLARVTVALSAVFLLGAFAHAGLWDSLKKVKENLGSSSANRKPKGTRGTAVAGVRGLDEERKSGDSGRRDFKAVEILEAVAISPEELRRFLRAGKLDTAHSSAGGKE